MPKARRLIHTQLDAEDCDVEMLRTVMSCLIVCCTSQRPAFNSLRGGGPSSSAHMIAVQLRQDRTPSETPEVVSQWLSVFARAGEPWVKLLITLAHIRDEVLAEPFAFLAQAVLDAAVPSTAAVSAVNGRVLRAASTTAQLQQQHYGWDALQVKLDAPAVAMLLECEPTRSSLVEPTGWAPLSIYGRNFRRGLALQWLSYLSASKAPAGREQRGANNGNKKRRAGAGAGAGAGVLLSAQLGGSNEAPPPDGAEELAAALSGTAPGVQTLLPLLRRRDWDLVLRLWSLATAPNPPSRQHRRQAMVALANISALAEVAHVLERVYALAKWVPSSCFLLPSLSPSCSLSLSPSSSTPLPPPHAHSFAQAARVPVVDPRMPRAQGGQGPFRSRRALSVSLRPPRPYFFYFSPLASRRVRASAQRHEPPRPALGTVGAQIRIQFGYGFASSEAKGSLWPPRRPARGRRRGQGGRWRRVHPRLGERRRGAHVLLDEPDTHCAARREGEERAQSTARQAGRGRRASCGEGQGSEARAGAEGTADSGRGVRAQEG